MNRTWDRLITCRNTDTPPAALIADYLRQSGWRGDPETGWTTTTAHGRARLQALSSPDHSTGRGLPPGRLNGLVQRQLASEDRAHVTEIITVLLLLEVLEGRSATAIWADITHNPDTSQCHQPTLMEQATEIACELADLGAYAQLGDIRVSWHWPMVAVDLDDDTVLIAIPTPPDEVPPGFFPGACWQVDLQYAPALAARMGQCRATYTPPAFTAPVLRSLADSAKPPR